MGTIKLTSHAIPPSRHNNERIRFYGGKPETIVEGEVVGLIERPALAPVHCRASESMPVCVMCGYLALPWVESEDRWAAHPMNCRASATTIAKE